MHVRARSLRGAAKRRYAALRFLMGVVILVAVGGAAPGPVIPIGDLPGWHQTFTENFDTPVALGNFPGSVYGSRWTGYSGVRDTNGTGVFEPSRVLSVHGGKLDMYLHTENGVALGAAPSPILSTPYKGQIYGRFAVRFKADALPGFHVAWLLWSDSNDWNDGEIDFPEGELSKTIGAYDHCLGNPQTNCLAVDTRARFTAWHTAVVEWLPSGVTFLLDGKVVGRSTNSPRVPMHLVLQTETEVTAPEPSVAGHVLVDWVTIYSRS